MWVMGTGIHRYGYGSQLEYLQTLTQPTAICAWCLITFTSHITTLIVGCSHTFTSWLLYYYLSTVSTKKGQSPRWEAMKECHLYMFTLLWHVCVSKQDTLTTTYHCTTITTTATTTLLDYNDIIQHHHKPLLTGQGAREDRRGLRMTRREWVQGGGPNDMLFGPPVCFFVLSTNHIFSLLRM